MQPTDVRTHVLIDYLQLSSIDSASYISKVLSKYFIVGSHKRNEHWHSNKYNINDEYTLIHSYNTENINQNTLKLCQPTIPQQLHLHQLLNKLQIQHKISKFELAFDLSPATADTTTGDIHGWMAMHLHQRYVGRSIDPFWYENTYYTRPTRQKQGRASRGLKLYQKIFGVQEVVRCEIEMKRQYLRRKGMKFPLTQIPDPVANTLGFLEFDQRKFEKFLAKENLRAIKPEPRSMQELVRAVQKKDHHWKKYFKPLDTWNEYFQQSLDQFNLEMAQEIEAIARDTGSGDGGDGGGEEDQDDGYD